MLSLCFHLVSLQSLPYLELPLFRLEELSVLLYQKAIGHQKHLRYF